MELKQKGNWNNAYKELQNDNNNSVSTLLHEKIKFEKNNNRLTEAVFTIKDNYATNFAKSSASSKILENFYPAYNATAVEKLLQNGALPIAKVNCDELALGGTGTFSAHGLIKNPLDNSRLAGGSSSGSIATLTNNVSFALASDTGDSVRLPASFCGKVGFKPSYGAISRYGLFAYASSLDTVAYFAHNVNDIALISQILYGEDEKDFTTVNVDISNIKKTKPKKIAIFNVDYLSFELKIKWEKFIKDLKNIDNLETEIVDPDIDVLRAIKPTYEIISYSEASSNLANLNGIAFGNRKDGNSWEEIMTNTRTEGFGKMVQRRLTLGSFFLYQKNQEELFIKAQKARRKIKNYFDNLHSQYDLIIYPAYASYAPLIKNREKNYDYMEYILTSSNLTGNPSITLPFAKINNLPINLALDAQIYKDEKLLSYALWIEEFIIRNKEHYE
ncbi:amidase family protein [Mycoplasma sp. 744]|uniref:amidase family protein n=1 Tax=Mycoplasma sp. 744 TaxID=3108531 RepID=UPI002B1DFADD|nr:amidase family protein [Mycoplasma sp. 744]MEA4115315.1 amidase family protein [Mycoplasma sp. 744]